MIRIMTILSLIGISQFTKLNTNADFEEVVNESYETYYYPGDLEYSVPDYEIKTVIGLINNEVKLGVYFRSANSKDYRLRILYNNVLYNISEDSRGDVLAVALNISSGEQISFLIYDKDNHLQSVPKDSLKEIVIPTLDEYSKEANLLIGLGNGVDITRLERADSFNLSIIILTVTAFVVLTCIFIIFVFYKKKRGMFSDDVRSKDVFNFREFLKANSANNNYDEAEVINDDEYDDNLTSVENKNENIEENKKLEFGFRHTFSRDEDEESDYNIKKHLEDKGFILNYKLLSEDEKNLITIELMRLKDEAIISKNEYLKEISELWKN